MNRLKDKVAIITGGAKGIGKVTAELFVREGAKVVIWDINENAAQQVIQGIEKAGGKAGYQQVDTTNIDEVKEAAKKVYDEHGQIDILINNAGITRDASLFKMTTDQWKAVIDVNLGGVFHCTQAVGKYMVQQQSGSIINASSVVGLYGNFGQTNYVATKSGVIGMTKVWARELGRKGVTVNAIAPGFIATEMIETVPEKIIHNIQQKTPLSRLGKPEDIAHAYMFLASAEASFINGAVLSVDGGITL